MKKVLKRTSSNYLLKYISSREGIDYIYLFILFIEIFAQTLKIKR